jgi:hypothetical protein
MVRQFAILLAAAAGIAPAAAQTVPANSPQVEQRVAQIAARAQTPAALGHGVVLTEVEARSTQLLLTMVSQARGKAMTEQDRAGIARDLCAFAPMLPLYRQGASTRAVMYDFNGAELAAVAVSASECAAGVTFAGR